jgi:hypothetical protein
MCIPLPHILPSLSISLRRPVVCDPLIVISQSQLALGACVSPLPRPAATTLAYTVRFALRVALCTSSLRLFDDTVDKSATAHFLSASLPRQSNHSQSSDDHPNCCLRPVTRLSLNQGQGCDLGSWPEDVIFVQRLSALSFLTRPNTPFLRYYLASVVNSGRSLRGFRFYHNVSR